MIPNGIREGEPFNLSFGALLEPLGIFRILVALKNIIGKRDVGCHVSANEASSL